MTTQTTQAQLATFFAGAKSYNSEPVYKAEDSITVSLDKNTRLVSNENGRSLQIRLNEKTVVYAALSSTAPMKETYKITKLVAVRDWDERNIKAGHITFKAE